MTRPSGIIPIPGFKNLRASWEQIPTAEGTLYGLLVYHASDHNFPEYISANGLTALHVCASGRCQLFVIHSPGQEYIDYARQRENLWAQLFDQPAGEVSRSITAIPGAIDHPFIDIDGERRSMRQLLTPSKNDFLLTDEVNAILRYFGCAPDEHPCLILFKDLNAARFWFVNLRPWTGWRLDALQLAFRNYFEGAGFSQIVSEAGHG